MSHASHDAGHEAPIYGPKGQILLKLGPRKPLPRMGPIEMPPEGTGKMIVDMGPSHPAMHGTVKMRVLLQGETVERCDVDVGYLHRGFEKSAENSTWTMGETGRVSIRRSRFPGRNVRAHSLPRPLGLVSSGIELSPSVSTLAMKCHQPA